MRVFFIFIFLFTSCSFMKEMKREVKINSQPLNAEVRYLTKSGEFKSVGQTPLVIEDAVIREWLDSHQEYVVIQVSKSGHAVENLIIDLSDRYKLDFTAQLKPIDVWNNKEMEMSSHTANKLAVNIQYINQQVFKKNFAEAMRSTEVMIDQYPKAHVFYDIKGSIFFLMGKRNEAQTSYQKSLSLNPDNNEAKQMLVQMKGEKQ